MATETTITRQAPYIEALGQQYGKDLTALTGKAMPTAGFAPTVAGQDQAQKDAYTMATTQGQGIGAYQPYLTQAGAYSGPSGYSSFMSPYQQQVINETLSQYDTQAAKGLAGIGLQAAKSGNLGGGREGVMRSEYQSQSDMNRAMLNAKLLQEGFGQAQKGAELGFNQQMQMAGAAPKFQGQDIATLGSAGAIQQAQTQATLDAQREANRMAAYEPYERLGYMGAGLGNILGGMQGQYTSTVTPNQSALQQAMGILGTGIGAYKTIMG
jgi:hypothetical protein|tara:strand:- start:2330 stop:3133 length:804 start_codon:yes stop_codon:yes gene_type:complete